MSAVTTSMTMLLELPASPERPAGDDLLAAEAWRCGVEPADGCGVTVHQCEEIVPELIVELI